MVNVFGESVGNGGSVDLQLAKKVVTTVGTFGDYIDEIRQSYELGFTPYILHTNSDVTPIRVYDGRVYVLDDETTMQVTNRKIASEKGEKGDAGGAGPQGPVSPKGSTGLIGVRGVEGVRGVAGPDGPKWPVGEKGDRGREGPVGIKGLVGNQGERGEHGQRGDRGEKGVQGDTSDVLSWA